VTVKQTDHYKIMREFCDDRRGLWKRMIEDKRLKIMAPVSHPGVAERELSVRKLSANRLSRDIGVPPAYHRHPPIAAARSRPTPPVRLGAYFGNGAHFWLDCRANMNRRSGAGKRAPRLQACQAGGRGVSNLPLRGN